MMHDTEPRPEHAAGVEKYMISTIDHGFNASTFTARVITSTGADLGAAVVGGIGALSGPLHGGAPSRALQMLDEIGTADRAEPWLRDAVERGDRLMGFGHRVYKTDDPRSLMLRDVADELGGEKMEIARHIEATAIRVLDELKPGPQAVHERRVLRRHRDGPLRRPTRAVHADVRGEPRDRLVHAHPRAGGRQPADPAQRAVRRAAAATTGARHPPVSPDGDDERVASLNEFFGPLVPGMLGVVFDRCTPSEVVAHIDVTDRLIAGTGFLFAPRRHRSRRHARRGRDR